MFHTHIVGLKPDYPALSCVGYRRYCPLFSNRTPRVDSLRPTFRWEPFPRVQDLKELGFHADQRITNVSYELRLWKVGEDFSGNVNRPGTSGEWIGEADEYKYSWGHECRDTDPGALVYTKAGLPSPEHPLETPLQPDSHYYWSIRAHFRLDGKRRATAWSELWPSDNFHAEYADHLCSPLATFHLFRTP